MTGVDRIDAVWRLGGLDAVCGDLVHVKGRTAPRLVAEWVDRHGGCLRTAWLAADDPRPMIALAVVAGFRRALEMAFLSASVRWASLSGFPQVVSVVSVMAETVDAPPQSRLSVVWAGESMWEAVATCRWRVSPGRDRVAMGGIGYARAVLEASGLWSRSTLAARYDSATQAVAWAEHGDAFRSEPGFDLGAAIRDEVGLIV